VVRHNTVRYGKIRCFIPHYTLHYSALLQCSASVLYSAVRCDAVQRGMCAHHNFLGDGLIGSHIPMALTLPVCAGAR
jgi:hypothetical protein